VANIRAMALSELRIDSAATLLVAALRAVRPRPALPRDCAPANLADAYAIQDRFVAHLGRPVGYKIGYANEAVQRAFGISEPVFGRLLADRVLQSPAALPAAGFATRVVETEFGVRMGRALPARAEPYSLEAVTEAVAAVMPSFEIVDSRFEEWRKLTPLEAVADNVLHSHWVAGPERTDAAGLDLASVPVVTRVNGREATRGTGAAVLGSPYRALHWLANALAQQGRGLGAGEWVTTGCCTEVLELAPGDVAEADFGPLGSVRVEFPV
jgi:2-keto-4-pentenoate hydratase